VDRRRIGLHAGRGKIGVFAFGQQSGEGGLALGVVGGIGFEVGRVDFLAAGDGEDVEIGLGIGGILGRGEAIGAIAMTGPSTSSDLKAIRTSARLEGDEYIINGAKTFISNGQLADLVIVVVRTNGVPGRRGISTEYPIARLFADARAQRIYGGANEVVKELVARAL